MEVGVLAHYSRTLGHSIDWNMDEGAIYHAATGRSVTVCGYSSDAPQRGASDRGWQFWGTDFRYRDRVNCKRCLRILAGEDGPRTPANKRQAVRRRDQRVKEAFDRLRDYLLEATRRYQPAGYEEEERKAWRHIFAECAYEFLRHTPECKGFQNFIETDWSCVESGALSRMYHEYWRPLALKLAEMDALFSSGKSDEEVERELEDRYNAHANSGYPRAHVYKVALWCLAQHKLVAYQTWLNIERRTSPALGHLDLNLVAVPIKEPARDERATLSMNEDRLWCSIKPGHKRSLTFLFHLAGFSEIMGERVIRSLLERGWIRLVSKEEESHDL